jgi:hypothetical protein
MSFATAERASELQALLCVHLHFRQEGENLRFIPSRLTRQTVLAVLRPGLRQALVRGLASVPSGGCVSLREGVRTSVSSARCALLSLDLPSSAHGCWCRRSLHRLLPWGGRHRRYTGFRQGRRRFRCSRRWRIPWRCAWYGLQVERVDVLPPLSRSMVRLSLFCLDLVRAVPISASLAAAASACLAASHRLPVIGQAGVPPVV